MRRGIPHTPRKCIGKKVPLKPMMVSQKCSLPSSSLSMPARDLGPPVVEPAEDREHHAAEQHVVEMRDDEVGVGLLEIDRHAGVHDAAQAADREFEDRPRARSRIAIVIRSEPPHTVAIQLKILIPVGIAISIEVIAKVESATGPMPVANM